MTDRKNDDLLASLKTDWCQATSLAEKLKWKPHTLRAAISGVKKKHKVERRRVDGITSYRIAPDA